MAFGGNGVGRLENGKVCFVPFVVPGERVTARIRKQKSSFVEADLDQVLEPSGDRVEPPCPVFGQCGGCQYQHISYSRQLQIKQQQVGDVLRRLGGVKDPVVAPTVASPLEYGYRNRITVHAGYGKVGFFAARSRRIIDVEQCPIASGPVNALLKEMRRSKPYDGEIPLREPGTFRGFRQVNDSVAGLLREVVTQAAQPGGPLLVDAYCGAGFFARHLSGIFQSVIGIEWSADAVRAAREEMLPHENYLLGDVRDHLGQALEAAPAQDTTLILDPPAEGLDRQVVDIILDHQPARLIYVSCNPGTMARDIKLLTPYTFRHATPVDMFPQTAEIETVAILEKS